MSNRQIPITIYSEYIEGDGVFIGASGSHDDVTLRITFGAPWDGLSKSILWKDTYGEGKVLTLLTADLLLPGSTNIYLVPVPAAPKLYPGTMYMTIKGVTVSNNLEQTATLTAFGQFKVLQSMWEETGDLEIPASAADQLQAEIEDVLVDIANIQSHAADAEAWANGTRDSQPIGQGDVAYGKDAKGRAEAAALSAENAAASEANASASELAASASETNAGNYAGSANASKTAAASSAGYAAGYATSARASELNAQSSAASALDSKESALESRNYAAASANAAAEDRLMIEQALQGLGSPFVYKGSLSTAGELPPSGNTAGDSYYIISTGTTYVWNGSSWENLSLASIDGGSF